MATARATAKPRDQEGGSNENLLPTLFANVKPAKVTASRRRMLMLAGCVGLVVWTIMVMVKAPDPVKQSESTVSYRPVPVDWDTTHMPVKIPRIIHQSWKSTEKIPQRFVPWMRSWIEKHPGWKYVYWSDADNLALFEKLYPRYLEVAKHVGKIGLADMSRYAMLHRLGGLYVDADFECTKPFDQLHRDYEIFLSSEPKAHGVLLEGSTKPALCNALMASLPHHPFWLSVLESIKAAYEAGVRGPVSLTGPRIVKQTFEQSNRAVNGDVVVLDPEYFYPEVAYWNLNNLRKMCSNKSASALVKESCAWLDTFPQGEFTRNTHATHHWQCTWCRGDGEEQYVSLAKLMHYSNNGAPMHIFKPRFTEEKPGVFNLKLDYYPLGNDGE